jgi:hypothetical protein
MEQDLIKKGLQQLGNPDAARKQAELLRLRAASPMRPVNGRTADVDGLGLFDTVRSPQLF